ncbi:MAG: anaerobic ribonucleoside-triphosphate reductase, partial [Paludibacteraceae bacterium]|nr:anaerobic ribonucleoside-triphosphate reductase [Paludibacteraceae bacterium]
IKNDITVEDIQNQVEVALMREGHYKVAKSFMLYRQQHTEDREVLEKIQFLSDYCNAANAASGSKYDANANVEHKNIATLIGELPKSNFIRLNRRMLVERIKKMYGKDVADKYIDLLTHHFIYKNDETSLANYCASITMYPWLIGGTTSIGGNSTAPTNLKSYCGGFVNMVFMVSSMLSGACATPEFLMYLNYFIGKEFGLDYFKRADEVVDLSLKHRTIDKIVTDCFEQIVYSINQPTGARNYQAVFWNVAYYDKYYFQSIFGDFYFPDGTKPDWDGLNWLQKRFMKWFNKERTKTVLTFPVETMALLSENGEPKDKEYGEFTAEMYAEGHSFFTYLSDNADSLSSCCRLRNEIQDNGVSYTLGAGGVSTGSKSVLTINLNRTIQNAVNHGRDYKEALGEVIDLCHKVQLAYNENLKELQKGGLLPLFDAGYINMGRQYLTIGVNGLVEAAEFMGIEITDNPKYREFVQGVLGLVEKYNKQYRTKEVMFNCEMIPAENVGVKHAKWDREDGYFVPRDCYNSYFYIVEDDSLNIVDKFKLHGAPYIEHLTGGSALHLNLEEHLSKEQYYQLICIAAKEGCNYFTFNIPNTICNDCGHIDKRYMKECPHCHSKNVDYLTRIIGYLKRVSNFSEPRQAEASRRFYAGPNKM